MRHNTNTALGRYRNLISQAEELEKMAGRGDYGGPSYWMDRQESTEKAIADANWKKPEGSIGLTWALPEESCRAIHAAFSTSHYDAIWRDGAKKLREWAASLKEEIRTETEAANAVMAELNGK